jgi:hypothetical protein
MNGFNDSRLGDAQQIVVAFLLSWGTGERNTSVIFFREMIPLNHRSHGSVEDEDPVV